MCATDTPLGIALRNIRIHSASFKRSNWFSVLLIIGDPRGDILIVGSIFRKLLTELGRRIVDAECNLMGEMSNFANLVLIIKVVWVGSIPRQAINTLVIKINMRP